MKVNKHLVCKLRLDANLKYLFDREANPNAHGNLKYNGKVNWNARNLNLWNLVFGRQRRKTATFVVVCSCSNSLQPSFKNVT